MKIRVKVNTNSKERKIIKKEDRYKIRLKNEAKNNKANKELINLLAKHFNVSAANIRIKSGLSSKKKIIEIKNGYI